MKVRTSVMVSADLLASIARLRTKTARASAMAITGIFSASRGETRGHPHRLLHAACVGGVASRDVEGRAVIDRRANDRNASGNVDRAFEIEELHRNVALVVVHRDHQIVRAARRLQENRVGGMRSAARNARGARAIDGGANDAFVLVAEESVLAGVRIQSADSDAWMRALQLFHRVIAGGNRLEDAIRVEMTRRGQS